ncbi:hypothetical protein G9P44_004773 [Scheffersomyces stipitis]|nr:hypothetical protein G9P44_004773 [Scheffersomyces stipitis]
MSFRTRPSPTARESPSGLIRSNQSHKRQFANDDDNTFLPPALSSYSIALLNDRTKNSPSTTTSNVTGIYELDFPESAKRVDQLKNRLSVHFKESLPTSSLHLQTDNDIISNGNDIKSNRDQSVGNISINSSKIQTNTSFHESNQPISSHSSFNNYSAHTHNTSVDEDLMNDGSSSPHTSASRTPATTPGSNTSNPGVVNSASRPAVHTIKRMRGARRFGRVLGPPQRASRISDIQDKIDLDTNSNNAGIEHSNEKEIDLDMEIEVGRSTPPVFSLGEFSPKVKRHTQPTHLLNSNVKSDSNLNSMSNSTSNTTLKSNDSIHMDLDFSSKEKGEELRRRIEERKALNELEMNYQRLRGSSNKDRKIEEVIYDFPQDGNSNIDMINEKVPDRQENIASKRISDLFENIQQENMDDIPARGKKAAAISERKPLSNVEVNTFAVSNNFENFRKPKLPRTSSEVKPQAIEKPVEKVTEVPTVQRPSSSIGPDEQKKKKSIIINGNHYEKLELLGRGGTSKVYKVKAIANNRLYAIKKVTFDQFDEACVKGFKGEIDLLLKLKHADRVVKLIDHAVCEGSIYLVMECGDLDLAHVLQNKLSMHKELDLNFVKYHAIEILNCVKAVHQSGIVHSDLKPANFLFVRGILKIIDFGIANAVPDHTANIYRESQIGTPNYMAPEAWVEVSQTFPGLPITDQNNSKQRNTWKVGKPSDVWSCGCMIYQMIYGKPPYGAYSGNQRVMAIMNPQVKIQFGTKGLGGVAVPTSAIELMQNCLARNPNERWTIEQCLNSDFLSPKIVSESFVRDLVHSAVNYGYNKRINGGGPMTTDVYDALVDSVLKQIENLNYG